jgi:hypothetical protein
LLTTRNTASRAGTGANGSSRPPINGVPEPSRSMVSEVKVSSWCCRRSEVVTAAGVVLDEHGDAGLAAESGGAGGGVEGAGNGVVSGGGAPGGGAALVFPAVDVGAVHGSGLRGVGRALVVAARSEMAGEEKNGGGSRCESPSGMVAYRANRGSSGSRVGVLMP